jgi:hypothetical protein
LSGNLPRHVRPLSKNLKLDQNLPFWFIPFIYLDLCDHVKILQCLNRNSLSIRKRYQGTISLWDLEQSHIFINSWNKFKHQRSDQANQDHILLRLSSVLFSRSLSSQNYIQSVGPRLLEEKNSHGYPSQNSFFEKFSSFVGNAFSMGLQPFYLWFQASKASLLSLKGLSFQGLFGSV